MVAINRIKPGDTLYEMRRVKMGNTTMTRETAYAVSVVEVHEDYILARWNGNAPEKMTSRRVVKLRRQRPTLKPTIFDLARAARNPA